MALLRLHKDIWHPIDAYHAEIMDAIGRTFPNLQYMGESRRSRNEVVLRVNNGDDVPKEDVFITPYYCDTFPGIKPFMTCFDIEEQTK